ncbi:hypothetical protein MBM_03113 [Drepanopeziza brunnea f. sp. 'multigermtubi' MB_m1]|uniref:Uncharacterized protein n=1 Tax=Marssonina brunnea f. sp. multigermtubi (strain MB_m1) TaxID=1072389 RepID=K1X0X8_MARBU|nr:uncharacterized protein MBM_03113 [Drepanopeziza brunnea f. sp. 'multigermtubi' MB_m1]EKD18871.1 hypothetical protein MBM_03113 [Drepanopeziza brunnea f. sp. 'multigermtubi' MB_m1]
MLFKQVIQFNRIVKRGRSRLRNLLSALAIATAIITAATAAILRTLTFEASPFPLDLFTKRLLMLTTVKALKCINVIRYLRCIKSSYSNCTAAFAAANTAFDNFLALNAAFSRGAASSPGNLANKSESFKSSLGSLIGFALALKTFNLNIAFIRLNSFVITNRGPMTRSASSISPFPLALAAFIALVAFAAFVALAAFVAFVALIIVAPFALIVALAALAAAPAVAITLAERRAKVKKLLKALVDLLL